MATDKPAANKGAYVLLFKLDLALEVTLRTRRVVLEPGTYGYCGSAMGPGGLDARIKRHLRRDKKVHWHVDQVTTQVPVSRAGTTSRLSECDLVKRVLQSSASTIPVPGFGSSDCKVCASHFLKFESERAFDDLCLETYEC
jgi:Uri superfamily endonuclease